MRIHANKYKPSIPLLGTNSIVKGQGTERCHVTNSLVMGSFGFVFFQLPNVFGPQNDFHMACLVYDDPFLLLHWLFIIHDYGFNTQQLT